MAHQKARCNARKRAYLHHAASIAELVCDLPRLCTRAEAAAALRRTTRTIDRLIAAGHLQCARPGGGHPLIPRSEIARLLKADEPQATNAEVRS